MLKDNSAATALETVISFIPCGGLFGPGPAPTFGYLHRMRKLICCFLHETDGYYLRSCFSSCRFKARVTLGSFRFWHKNPRVDDGFAGSNA